MEKRIGAAVILVEDPSSVARINQTLSKHEDIILGRQGLPLQQEGVRVISLILKGSTDAIGALAGRIGRLPGVQIKTVLTAYQENPHEHSKQEP